MTGDAATLCDTRCAVYRPRCLGIIHLLVPMIIHPLVLMIVLPLVLVAIHWNIDFQGVSLMITRACFKSNMGLDQQHYIS